MNAIVPARQPQSMALRPQTFGELVQFAERAARSSMVPKDYINRPDNILVAVQMGSELGLAPMQALQNIAVVNGRPAVFGDAMPGLCKASPVCEDIEESLDGTGDAMVATCIAKRRGSKPVTAHFSVADAKKAGLWGKAGPWTQYPQRMLQMRARSWALRDAFPDVLKGLIAAEEAQDIPDDSRTIDARPEPVRLTSRPVTVNDTVTAAALDDGIPALDPPPVPNPLATLRDRLARCADRADVLKVGDGWGRTLAKAEAAGKALPAPLVEAAHDMLADRLGTFAAAAASDDLAAGLDDDAPAVRGEQHAETTP